jgi:hypothetical protein
MHIHDQLFLHDCQPDLFAGTLMKALLHAWNVAQILSGKLQNLRRIVDVSDVLHHRDVALLIVCSSAFMALLQLVLLYRGSSLPAKARTRGEGDGTSGG